MAIHAGDLMVGTRGANIMVLNCLDRLAEPVSTQLLLTLTTQISEHVAGNEQKGTRSDRTENLHDGQQ